MKNKFLFFISLKLLNRYKQFNWIENFFKALDYNVPHGKKIRGLTVVIAYKDLMVNEPLTPEKVRLAHLLGWCVEIVSTFNSIPNQIRTSFF